MRIKDKRGWREGKWKRRRGKIWGSRKNRRRKWWKRIWKEKREEYKIYVLYRNTRSRPCHQFFAA